MRLQAGQFALHHPKVWHRASVNLTGAYRVGVVFRFFSAAATREAAGCGQARLVTGVDREGRFGQVHALVDFGEWLHANRFPVHDVVDQFLAAADILMEVMHPGFDADLEDVGGTGRVVIGLMRHERLRLRGIPNPSTGLRKTGF